MPIVHGSLNTLFLIIVRQNFTVFTTITGTAKEIIAFSCSDRFTSEETEKLQHLKQNYCDENYIVTV